MPRKFFDDEFLAKRVWQDFIRRKNSTKGYKLRLKQAIAKNPAIEYKKRIPNSEVVIKITGASRSFEHLKAHLRYISRGGELEISTSDETMSFKGKESLKDLSKSFNRNSHNIPTQSEIDDNCKMPQREALHIVFSLKGCMNAPASKIKQAAEKTIKELYPDNYFVIATHKDTDNPHCHLVLKTMDKSHKRLDLNKQDLAVMRERFASNLRELSIKATATHKSKNTGKIRINENYASFYAKAHKDHHYKIVDFGEAHFNFNLENDMSYYVRYITSKGKEVTLWAKDLKRVVKENNIKAGEYCRFAITDEEPKIVIIKDKKNPNIIYTKVAYEKKWDVSVENRLEKILKPLKSFHKSTFSTNRTGTKQNEKYENSKTNEFSTNTQNSKNSSFKNTQNSPAREIKINFDISKTQEKNFER